MQIGNVSQNYGRAEWLITLSKEHNSQPFAICPSSFI